MKKKLLAVIVDDMAYTDIMIMLYQIFQEARPDVAELHREGMERAWPASYIEWGKR